MEESNGVVEIKNKLSEIFKGIREIHNIKYNVDGSYEAVDSYGDSFFFNKDSLKEEENTISINFVEGSDILGNLQIIKRSKAAKNSQLSMISIGKRGPISMLKEGIEPDFNYEYSAIIDLDDNILFSLDENKEILDEKEEKIEDINILKKLKEIIEENFIKTDSLLSGKDMVVNLGIAETYEIFLNQINGLTNSKDIGVAILNNTFLHSDLLSKSEEKQFRIDNLNIIMEIPYNYTNGFVCLQDVLKMAEFKKHNEIKEQLEKFIEEKQMDKDDNICDVINKLKRRTDITDDECETFSNNINEIFHFVVKRDGEHNEIRHAANIVFSDDGKKYLIDSSLAAYEYLFVKDLALNDEKDGEYNVELFDTQKIVPGCDLTKIYSVQEGGSCKLWSVFLNVETNKMIKDNPGRDPIEVINNNFDEIFLNASLGMSELIDKKKAVLFEKPVGTDKSLYKPCNFNNKTIYVLSTDDSDLKSKCVKTDVLINMIHKHEVERIINEEIIKDNKVIDHDKFQQLSSLLDTMEKDGLNAYVKSVKERKPELGRMLDSIEVMRKESRLYKDKTKKLKEEFNRLMSQRPKFVSSGRKLEGKEKKLEEEKHKKIKTQLNKKRKEINKVKNYSSY